MVKAGEGGGGGKALRGQGQASGVGLGHSPARPSNGTRSSKTKRVQAQQQQARPIKHLRSRPGHSLNHLESIFDRQLGSRGFSNFKRYRAKRKFKDFRLTGEFDTYDPKAAQFQKLPFLKRRSRIVEIVAARDLLFALAHSGACAAISQDTKRRICFLNTSPEEVIRSLFYNKNNDSLISVSVYAFDNFSSLKCHTTPVEYIRRGKPDQGFPLFESESLRWPGFVEFDDVNGKVLTYSAEHSVYKVFDLKNYNLLYQINDKNIQEIKISPGIMLLIHQRSPAHVPLKILNIEDGSQLSSFTHMLHRTKKIDFIEQFNEKLLVKQENENLQILDVRTSEIMEVGKTEFMTPSAFIFLYENQLFLTFRNRKVSVWNFKGEMVTSFEDHLLWYPDCNTNNIYITAEQDLILSYCKAEGEPESSVGTINVSNILTGKLLAKVTAELATRLKRKEDNFLTSPKEALEDVTVLFYDEERNEIYTGNRNGFVHVWSN